MTERLRQRLEALREEFESGQKMLSDKEAECSRLRETLLRISGAIQVLEEELGATAEDAPQPPEPAPKD